MEGIEVTSIQFQKEVQKQKQNQENILGYHLDLSPFTTDLDVAH